ncbi:MAG: hypothetical protein ACRDRX_03725 [Pseudonocardiaceae bacterium]
MAVSVTVLAATLLIGVLIGCTFCERLLEARTRRQATAQRSLNSQRHELARQWRELEAARQEFARQREAQLRRPAQH